MPLTTIFNPSSQSELSSRLSSAPDSELLDGIEAELGSAHTGQSDSDIERRPAKRRRNNQGIDFIEVLRENTRRKAWYWTHGQEWTLFGLASTARSSTPTPKAPVNISEII